MEKKKNYSRKREAILQILRGTKSHPTAEWIYQQLKPSFPDLSLGTVYRNLSRFKEEGTIISVGNVNGQERYDADVTPHSHFVCTCCGSVQDVEDEFVDPESDREVSQILNAMVLSHQVIFYGVCGKCLAKCKTEKEDSPF